ncbi:MAG: DHA2 family efflux MFS transporter permease subunit [Gammaproteobacteria bacterium]|nr:DHA2 family efflux MFS transporter permease subunit [Gammaproteobacteria bacterium]
MIKNIEYKYWLVIIYTVVLFLDRLDLSIVNITLPTLAQYFNASITQTQWVSTAFLLALAISIPISGWLGDKFGLKKVFIIAISLYGASSSLCALAPSMNIILALRFLQGIGGGLIIPVGMTLVYRAFHPSEYARITAITFLPSLLAPALAPFIGGILLQSLGWQWVFSLVGPICLVAVVAALLIIKEQKHDVKPLDWLGFILASAFLIMLLYSVSILEKHGLDAYTVSLLLTTLCLIIGLILYEKRCPHPLINLNFFKSHLFVQANLIQLAFQISHYGAIFLIALYLQLGLGFTVMQSGLILGLQAIGAMLGCHYSPKLFNRFGPSFPLAIGLLGISISTPLILCLTSPDQIMLGIGLLVCRGIFIGLCGPAIQTSGMLDFDNKHVSRASAIFTAGRQISISIGLCLSSLLISYGLAQNEVRLSDISPSIAYAIFHYAFFMISIASILGAIVTLTIDNRSVLNKIKPC